MGPPMNGGFRPFGNACWGGGGSPPSDTSKRTSPTGASRPHPKFFSRSDGALVSAGNLDFHGPKMQDSNRMKYGFNYLRSMFFAGFLLVLLSASGRAEEVWREALAKMPLTNSPVELNRTNAVQLMLSSFQRSQAVKALVFMPGATDEFYFFKRAKAQVTNSQPRLLDAVDALVRQTRIQATFQSSFLLLHTDEDDTRPGYEIISEERTKRLQQTPFVEHALYYDRDWDFVEPILSRKCRVWISPKYLSHDSYHFYRHSLAMWDVNCWEALEAISLAGQTGFRIEKSKITFEHEQPKSSLLRKARPN